MSQRCDSKSHPLVPAAPQRVSNTPSRSSRRQAARRLARAVNYASACLPAVPCAYTSVDLASDGAVRTLYIPIRNERSRQAPLGEG